MHPSSLSEMARLLKGRVQPGMTCLDAGSLDVNGSYREMVEGMGLHYTGLDVANGNNVDVVAEKPYRYPLTDDAFDAVISGQVMEHVEKPWLWVPELARVLRPGGLLVIITHHTYPEHRYPVDCYRYMPDGLRVLLDEAGCLHSYDITMLDDAEGTISAVAWKVDN